MNQVKPAIIFILLAFALWNCKEDPNGTGMELLPGTDLKTVEQSIDSVSIKAFTQVDGPLRTDETNYNVFGTFNDPFFGKTTADMAFQVRMPYYSGFSDTLHLDSLVLHLEYVDYYGDTVTAQTLKVYELKDDIFIDTISDAGTTNYPYYQDVDLKSLAYSNPIGELSFIPKYELDTTGTKVLIQDLAIKLDQSIAEKLFTADSSEVANNEAFLNFFKGLYVEPQQDLLEGGTLIKIETMNMDLHFSYYKADTVYKAYTYRYNVNSESARISGFVHDYSNTSFADQLEASQPEPDSLIYLQTLGGLRAKVEIPSLENWKDSAGCAINKAELIFHVDTLASEYNKYEVPELLYLNAVDSEGVEYLPYDYSVSPALYGGTYNPEDATYRFILTHQLQRIIDGDIESSNVNRTTFYLWPGSRNERARRVIIKGSTSHVGIRLEVTYTKVN